MKKFLLLAFILIQFSAIAQKAVPELWGIRVHDDAHLLKQKTVDALEARLKAFEDSTSNQIAILIIPSLEGELVEEYSLRVVEKWKIGTKENDNGALLLIAVDDHKIRIETGLGLEGTLTDAVCNKIIRNDIAPSFRAGNYDEGITTAIDNMIKAIGGEYTADAGEDDSVQSDELTTSEKIWVGAFIFLILGLFTTIGLFASGATSWVLYFFLIPFYAIFPFVVLGMTIGLTALLSYLIGFPIARIIISRSKWGQRLIQKLEANQNRGSGGGSSTGTGSGWSSGSGSSWSSSSSSRGFSGGGGSFGGGGSSGSW